MDELEPLVSIEELKANRLRISKEKKEIFAIRYDDDLDTLILWLIEPREHTVVYFVDDYVGLIHEEESLEVIGVQIDDFAEGFLPQHEGVARAWQLSKASHEVNNFGDIILTFEKVKPKVAHEIMQATSEVVRPEAEALAEALDYI